MNQTYLAYTLKKRTNHIISATWWQLLQAKRKKKCDVLMKIQLKIRKLQKVEVSHYPVPIFNELHA